MSDRLLALALSIRDEALARKRAAFQEKWGRFLKCELCGARSEYTADQKLLPYPHTPEGWCLRERCYCDGVLVLCTYSKKE